MTVADQHEEIYSLLIPMGSGRLLVPRGAVAEVVGNLRVTPMEEQTPDWLLGRISWNNLAIPLVSFEGISKEEVTVSQRDRMVVFIAVDGRLDPPFFAMVTQGHPHLVRVSPQVIRVGELQDGDGTRPIITRARMATEQPMVPDLLAIGDMIGDALGLAGGPAPEEGADGPSDAAVDEVAPEAAAADDELIEDLVDPAVLDEISDAEPVDPDAIPVEDTAVGLDALEDLPETPLEDELATDSWVPSEETPEPADEDLLDDDEDILSADVLADDGPKDA